MVGPQGMRLRTILPDNVRFDTKEQFLSKKCFLRFHLYSLQDCFLMYLHNLCKLSCKTEAVIILIFQRWWLSLSHQGSAS